MTQTSGLFVLVGVALATAGCGERKHSPIEGETKIEGALVVLQVSCIGEQNVEALGRKGRCYDATPYQFRIPGSVLGAGKHTVKVTGTKDSSPPVTTTIEVEVDVPEAALAAVLSVQRCAESGTDVRVNARRDLACKLAPDASVKLVIDASPKAKLTFDGDVIDVPDSGLVEPRVDVGKRFLALAIDELSAVTAENEQMQIPWKLDAGGKTTEGKLDLEFNLVYAFKTWLRYLMTAKQRPAFTPKPGLILVWGPDGQVVPSEKHHKVSELAAIVIGTLVNQRNNGTCQYTNQSRGDFSMARVDFDAKLEMLDTATGAVTTPPPVVPHECPMFEFRMVDQNGNSVNKDVIYLKPNTQDVLNEVTRSVDVIGAEMGATFERLAAAVKATKGNCEELGRKLKPIKDDLAQIVAKGKSFDQQALTAFQQKFGKQLNAALAPSRAGLAKCSKEKNVQAFLEVLE